MIALDDIPEMMEELKSGNLTLRDFYFLCIDLLENHEVNAVLPLLPEYLRDGLVAELVSWCDSDRPAEDFLLLSSARGDHPAKLVIVERIRRWLRERNRR